ncbi:hypothetical protein PTTW11_03403 [Pyrenophora teres f. teres]|uniref:Uncharacterized protein n=1 Tax=Pyrenophora teres f. teres TaxID=97479 RepID=A0A6S6VUE7_9PLEO|nr:hypothetical protein PTTW11_03403 [Pyrenophora teres f. teres]
MRSCIHTRCRPVNDDDIGLKVLREAPGEAAQSIDIFAIHGLGAHPDDSWCANVGTGESPRPVNWLMEESMLPADVPFRPLMFIARCFGGLVVLELEMLEATRCEYHEDQVQPTVLEVLQPGNVYLREVVDSYLKKIRGQINKTEIACFFELKPSNGGMIVGKEDRKWALKGGA